MERKIGEIFEYNGEWYQAVKSQWKCLSCDLFVDGHCISDFSLNGSCFSHHRKDKEEIMFKKLEKVGEPYIAKNSIIGERLFQKYKLYKKDFFINEKNEGKKNDRVDGKVRMELLPWPELEEVAKVLSAGAKKYGANNWQGLEDGYNRYLGAMLRHLTEVEKGNAVDADTGCYHIAQVACNALFMLHFKLEEYGRAK